MQRGNAKLNDEKSPYLYSHKLQLPKFELSGLDQTKSQTRSLFSYKKKTKS